MAKGILLELHGRNAVVLTSQGEFRRVPVPAGAWEVGDEIDIPAAQGMSFRTTWSRWGLAGAAAAVLMLSPAGYQSWALAQPVAVVTVDINPSMRLILNKHEQVLTAEGLNDDGVTLLEGVEWKRRPFGEVVADLTAQAVADGTLNLADEAGAVVVAVAPAKQEELPQGQADSIATDARNAIQAEVQQQGKARDVAPVTNVAVLQGTAQEKAAAEVEGLSLGQHLMLQEIHRSQAGAHVAPDQMKQHGASHLLRELQISPGPIFNQAEERHGGKGRTEDRKNDDNGKAASVNQGRPTGKPGDVTGVRQPGGDDNGRSDDGGKPDEKAKPDDKARPDDKADGKDDDKADGKDDDKDDGKGDRQNDDRDDEQKDGRDDDRDKYQEGEGNQNGNQGGRNAEIRLPVLRDRPKPPVIRDPFKDPFKDLFKGEGEKESDSRTQGSGSKSSEKDGGSDGHDDGRRSREREKEGDNDNRDEKDDDKEKRGKRP